MSHGNVARLTKQLGDIKLAQICGTIVADEKGHEAAYTKVVKKLFEIDPDATILAFADMMKKNITMLAHLMYDGHALIVFDRFAAIAARISVKDYADVMQFLAGYWQIDKLIDLFAQGRKAQEYLCGLPQRIRVIDGRALQRTKQEGPLVGFSWVYNRNVKF